MIWLYIIACIIAIFAAIYMGRALWDHDDSIIKALAVIASIFSFMGTFLVVILIYIFVCIFIAIA